MADFARLRNRIEQLGVHFLPPEVIAYATTSSTADPPPDGFTPSELDSIAAFPVFVHAEIEYFCETAAKEVAGRALHNWQSTGAISNVLWSLIVDDLMQNQTRSIQEIDTSMIEGSVTNFYSRLNSSHGIKARNVNTLFRPIGVKVSELDNLWLSELEWLGKYRGDIVHTASGAIQMTSPDVVYKRIMEKILPPLENLNAELATLIQAT